MVYHFKHSFSQNILFQDFLIFDSRSRKVKSIEPLHEKNQHFAFAKTKAQITFAVIAKLISAFVFTTHRLDNSFTFLIKNFRHLAISCACTARFVSDLFGNHIVGFLMTQLHSISEKEVPFNVKSNKPRFDKMNIWCIQKKVYLKPRKPETCE